MLKVNALVSGKETSVEWGLYTMKNEIGKEKN